MNVIGPLVVVVDDDVGAGRMLDGRIRTLLSFSGPSPMRTCGVGAA